MKRKTKGTLIAILFSLLAVCLLAGCKDRATMEDLFNDLNLTSKVTYYANGGEFEDRETIKVMGYRDGSRVLNLGIDEIVSSDKVTISYSEHTIIGWYEVEMQDGKPVYLDEGKGIVKLTDKAVSFDEPIDADEEWHIGMKWKEYAKINFRLVCENPEETLIVDDDTEEGTSYKHGDVIKTRSFFYGPFRETNVAQVKIKDNSHTFFAYYTDEACTQILSDEVAEQEEDLTVYAKYLTGNWSVVRTKSEFEIAYSKMGAPMSKLSAGLYLANDIDCTGVKVSPIANFQNRFKGNGHTVSNLTVEQTKIVGGQNVSLFGNIMDTAVIENVVFENLSISLKTMNNAKFNAYFAFTSLAGEAKVENVKLSGKMSIDLATEALAVNMKDDFSNSLFGGYETDEAYVTESAGKGITVEGNPDEFITIQ